MIIQSGEVMNAIPEQTGHGISDMIVTTTGGMISAYIGIAMAFTVLIVLVQILIAIITIMYVQKRKDLFLSSEKDLKSCMNKKLPRPPLEKEIVKAYRAVPDVLQKAVLDILHIQPPASLPEQKQHA